MTAAKLYSDRVDLTPPPTALRLPRVPPCGGGGIRHGFIASEECRSYDRDKEVVARPGRRVA